MVVNRVQPLADYTDAEVAAAQTAENAAARTLYLKVESETQPGIRKLLPILRMFPGRMRTVIYYADTGKRRVGGSCMPDDWMLGAAGSCWARKRRSEMSFPRRKHFPGFAVRRIEKSFNKAATLLLQFVI